MTDQFAFNTDPFFNPQVSGIAVGSASAYTKLLGEIKSYSKVRPRESKFELKSISNVSKSKSKLLSLASVQTHLHSLSTSDHVRKRILVRKRPQRNFDSPDAR